MSTATRLILCLLAALVLATAGPGCSEPQPDPSEVPNIPPAQRKAPSDGGNSDFMPKAPPR